MKECLNCKREYEPKRATSKFCSTNCRVLYHQKHGKSKIKPIQMQALYNSLMEAIDKMGKEPMPNYFQGPKEATVVLKDPFHESRSELGYNDLVTIICAATSAAELHSAWKLVEKAKGLAAWHLRELIKLKELQQTKIDF